MKNFLLFSFFLLILYSCKSNDQAEEKVVSDTLYSEPYRPQVHFSPKEKWMNDPNGMVYYDGEYHLFYQYYPDSTVWGPMHWGHAITKDLLHWEHLPIAIAPDSLGLIFSGSAVVDVENTSGMGTKANPPMVAIYTYHSMEKEKKGRTDYQTQGMAFSVDKGRTWTKYEKNPIIKNPGIKDFRDPKVFWYAETKKWLMILAASDHMEIYSSSDLKAWTKLSDFGKTYGSHGGVWECPDLFQMETPEHDKQWVMIVSINPGGPNGGSGTQYFTGEFDGKKFTTKMKESESKWLDYGPDNYAGVTWSNAPDNRRIFLGWMNNWAYANVVPTLKWRGALASPRELALTKINNDYFVTSKLVDEWKKAGQGSQKVTGVEVKDAIDFKSQLTIPAVSLIEGTIDAKDFIIEFSNTLNQKLKIGLDTKNNRYYIDRSLSGKSDFSKDFFPIGYADRISDAQTIRFTIVLDVSSIEIFLDDGLSVMTTVFFPDEPLNQFKIYAGSVPLKIDVLEVNELSSIWK